MRYFYVFLPLIILFLLSDTINAQNQDITVDARKFISVTQIEDNLFLVENLSDVELGIYTESSGRIYKIKPKKYRHLNRSELGDNNLIKLYLDLDEYIRITKLYEYTYVRETWNQVMFKGYDMQVKEAIKKKKNQEGAFDIEDKMLEGLYKLLSYGTREGRKDYKKEIAEKYRYYTNLFAASRYNGKLKDGRTVSLIPYNLNNAAKNTSKAEGFIVNKKNLFYYGIGTSGASPGDNWNSEISYFGMYGRRLWKGFMWSGRTHTSFYGFLRYDSDAYTLIRDEKDFFIGRDYIQNASQDFFSLASDANVALRTNHPSAGIMFRTYRFNSLSLDLGGGYQFAEWNKLKFRDVEDDESPASDSPFVDSEFKNVVDYEGAGLYGMVNLGWTFEVPSKRGKGHTSLSFLISSRFWQRELIVNEEFEIYEDQNGSLERISVTDKSTLFYTVNFSMGFLF